MQQTEKNVGKEVKTCIENLRLIASSDNTPIGILCQALALILESMELTDEDISPTSTIQTYLIKLTSIEQPITIRGYDEQQVYDAAIEFARKYSTLNNQLEIESITKLPEHEYL